MSSLSRLLPRAAAQALIALVVTGGAIGASAAAGGPNVPVEAVQAVGLVNETEPAEDSGKSSAPSQIKKATATANTAATGTADLEASETGDHGRKGHCNAYTKGGLGQKAQARGKGKPAGPPLARLEAARGSQSIAAFCADVLAQHAASAQPDGDDHDEGKGKALGKLKKERAGLGKSSLAPGQLQ